MPTYKLIMRGPLNRGHLNHYDICCIPCDTRARGTRGAASIIITVITISILITISIIIIISIITITITTTITIIIIIIIIIHYHNFPTHPHYYEPGMAYFMGRYR